MWKKKTHYSLTYLFGATIKTFGQSKFWLKLGSTKKQTDIIF